LQFRPWSEFTEKVAKFELRVNDKNSGVKSISDKHPLIVANTPIKTVFRSNW
jgi:hypothetical protein